MKYLLTLITELDNHNILKFDDYLGDAELIELRDLSRKFLIGLKSPVKTDHISNISDLEEEDVIAIFEDEISDDPEDE